MFNLFKKSFLELKKTKTIVICGLLLAISLILNTQSIKVGQITVISFSFISNSISGFLFGPFVAGILAGLTDFIGHFLNPMGNYFFGFTFNAILRGIFFGLLLYRTVYGMKNLSIRIIISKLLIAIIVSVLLGTLWSAMFFGKSFFVLLVPRIYKNIIEVPIHSLIIYAILKMINKVYYQLNL